MWEWLFSHPVNPAGVFFAELLAPIAAANPRSTNSAPRFSLTSSTDTFSARRPDSLQRLSSRSARSDRGVLCGGNPLKSVRCCDSPRSPGPRYRHHELGRLCHPGFSCSSTTFGSMEPLRSHSRKRRDPSPSHSHSLALAGMDAWSAAGWHVFIPQGRIDDVHRGDRFGDAASIAFSVWTRIAAFQARSHGNPSSHVRGEQPALFGGDPLYRKEMLWFLRDRSAVIQTLLIPLTIAGIQIFNMRGMVAHAQHSWNYLCGAAISFFGTYFLFVLGTALPRVGRSRALDSPHLASVAWKACSRPRHGCGPASHRPWSLPYFSTPSTSSRRRTWRDRSRGHRMVSVCA